jgi:hypothetical protein
MNSTICQRKGGVTMKRFGLLAVLVVVSVLTATMFVCGMENDFDGDGTTDFGCYYAPGGNWYFYNSSAGFSSTTFGYAGTVPVMSGIEWASISIAANPVAGGTVSGNPTTVGSLPAGSVLQISAAANPGWLFTGWSDGVTASSRAIVVPREGFSVTALFGQDPRVTVTGTLSLPADASGRTWVVVFDNDTNGDNGSVYERTGICGAGTEIEYVLSDVPVGTHYVYAVVFVSSDGLQGGPQPGDFWGIYDGSFPDDAPNQPNATVSSGMNDFDIALSVRQ